MGALVSFKLVGIAIEARANSKNVSTRPLIQDKAIFVLGNEGAGIHVQYAYA